MCGVPGWMVDVQMAGECTCEAAARGHGGRTEVMHARTEVMHAHKMGGAKASPCLHQRGQAPEG